MCSGKVYYDLFEEREKRGIDDIYLLRLEQLYPCPAKALITELSVSRRRKWYGARKSRKIWAPGVSSNLILNGVFAHIKSDHKRARYAGVQGRQVRQPD